MTLIERYVNEIARRLPRKQRNDVRKELRSALADALDNRVEGEASEEEILVLLREFGRPEAVAASYLPENQYLVGPNLYPTFKTVTGVVLTVLASLVTLGFLVDLVGGPPEAGRLWLWILGFLGEIWDTALSAFGIIVLIFALLQRFDDDEPEEPWDPRELPEVRNFDLVGHGEAIVGIVIPAFFLVLLNVFKDHFGVRVEPGSQLLLNEVFQESLPWLSLALLLGIVLNAWLLRTGRWHWPTRLFNFGINVCWIVILFRIAGGVAAREATLINAGVTEPVLEMFVWVVTLIPWVVVLLVLWGTAMAIYRSFKGGGSAR